MALVYLARHGETASNVEQRFQGQDDTPLNATGREQARALARAAATHELAALWCSPQPRAVETALAVAEATGLEPRRDPRFMECDCGDWTGRLFADVERDDPAGWAAYHATDPDFRFPGGESLEDQQDRVVEALADVTHSGVLPALVVCHRGVIRAIRAHTHREGLATYLRWDVPNGTLEPL